MDHTRDERCRYAEQRRSYLSDVQLAKRYSSSRASIWRWSKQGRLPPPVRISPGCTRWLEAEIDEFDAAREAARGNAA